MITSGINGSLDNLLRSALYCTAANKEMRYIDRQYHTVLQELIKKYKYEEPVEP